MDSKVLPEDLERERELLALGYQCRKFQKKSTYHVFKRGFLACYELMVKRDDRQQLIQQLADMKFQLDKLKSEHHQSKLDLVMVRGREKRLLSKLLNIRDIVACCDSSNNILRQKRLELDKDLEKMGIDLWHRRSVYEGIKVND